ncbi:MAG: L,D-transpeptidase [Hyphomicrobiaceae bacterium]|nr:L,D-transpeptidase [Hyphomicrobiaceae bacterium]
MVAIKTQMRFWSRVSNINLFSVSDRYGRHFARPAGRNRSLDLPKILVQLLLFSVLAFVPTSDTFAEPYNFGDDGGYPVSGSEAPQQLPARRTYRPRQYPALMSGGARPQVLPKAPGVVNFPNKEAAGTVIIVNRRCKLYYTLSPTTAYEYPISIGRLGFTWTGTEKISRVVDWPDWIPPPEMLKRQPGLPRKMTGGVDNPLGARALYLGSSLYRIHGTNNIRTIGHAASSGCFRMMNEHVMHLSTQTRIGTKVKVVENWPLAGGYGSQQFCGAEIPVAQRQQQQRAPRQGGGGGLGPLGILAPWRW